LWLWLRKAKARDGVGEGILRRDGLGFGIGLAKLERWREVVE